MVFAAIPVNSSGCYYTRVIPIRNKTTIDSTIRPYKAEMKDGKFLDFKSDMHGHAHLKDSAVVRPVADSSTQSIPLSEIKALYIRKESPLLTILPYGFLLSAVGLVLIMISWK